MLDGVTIIDPNATYVDEGVRVGRDTVIYPMTVIEGDTSIGEGCTIGPGCTILDSEIGRGVVIRNSVVQKSVILDNTTVGPFANIRPESQIGPNAKIGDFVEIKKSTVGDGTKISHLTYVGDAHVGSGVNIGAGVVFVNYDGKYKHLTTVEDGAFIGCNANLIAPVKVGKNAYVAAGSTITDEVPGESLAIARSRQTVKKDWKMKRKDIRKS
jgi:bifunctional UDP-N-acetylglucosamine pyrophosphorylase/glucosamine-1-phosphate N-acetyltransferase